MQITEDIKKIKSRFDSAGKELYLVGGCVRDYLLGFEPKDFDMVTDAFPEEIEAILSDYRLDLTGKQFGVMRVYTEAEPKGYEIATYREDETVGRKPKVKIGSTMKADSMRRDLTINALYMDIDTGVVIDMVGGVGDVHTKTIRACGEPRARFNEDALRIIRAIRFKHTIGGELSNDLAEAIMENPMLAGPDEHGKIVPISQERISEEFLKGFSRAADTHAYIKDLFHFKIIEQVFRELIVNPPLEDSEVSTPEVMMALLLYPNKEQDILVKLVQTNKFPVKMAEGVNFVLSLFSIGPQTAYKVRKKLNKTNLSKRTVEEFIPFIHPGNRKSAEAFLSYDISVNGEDVKKELGIKDGPELGAEIERREREIFTKLIKI